MVLVKMQQNIMTCIMIIITLPKKYLVLLKIKIFHVLGQSGCNVAFGDASVVQETCCD